MKFPPVKVITTAVSKAANTNFNLALQETPRYINAFKEDVVYKKISDVNRWYTKIIGLDEVKMYQDRVFDLQQRLLNAQEKRREIGTVLSDIRKKSNELQDQIHKVKRSDDLERFLDLMKLETEMLKQEKDATQVFANCDREEREIFTAFTNAIRDSHEKQRAQLEYTKYFGLILSITGSFLAFMYSSVKKHDLKNFIETQMQMMSMNADPGSAILSTQLLQNINENQMKNEAVINTIMNNHRQLMYAINRKKDSPVKEVPAVKTMDLINEMPDGEKLLWFSVLSLVGLMILKKFFN